MQTLCMTALIDFRQKCFIDNIKELLCNTILTQLSKERKGESIDCQKIRNCIKAFVELGMINADIKRIDEEILWKGDKNLQIYDT